MSAALSAAGPILLTPRKRLGEILMERKLITQEDLDRALELQKDRGDKLGKALVDLGFIAMRDVLAAIEKQEAVNAATNAASKQAGDASPVMATLKKRIEDPREIDDPNVVKVVTNLAGDAIYFSRCPIPFDRDRATGSPYYKHIGLYVYRTDFLCGYPSLPIGPLERTERLEQLRALENGFRIRVAETEYESMGVDTPADLARVARLFEISMERS